VPTAHSIYGGRTTKIQNQPGMQKSELWMCGPIKNYLRA